MTKCDHTNCYNELEEGNPFYCKHHSDEQIKRIRKRLHEIPKEEKELLK